jgi:hypothetical protein
MAENVLYLAVLPFLAIPKYGPWEIMVPDGQQIMTLVPDKTWATMFFPDEVDRYLNWWKGYAERGLTSAHVHGYDYLKENAPNGRVLVKVVQRVG